MLKDTRLRFRQEYRGQGDPVATVDNRTRTITQLFTVFCFVLVIGLVDVYEFGQSCLVGKDLVFRL